MLFKEINPFIRQALTAQLTKQNKTDTFNKLKTVDARLFYIIDGNGKMRFKNKSCDLHADTIILFSAGTEYTWEVDTINYYAINFDYTQNYSHVQKTFHPIKSNFYIDTYFEVILDNPGLYKFDIYESYKENTKLKGEPYSITYFLA